MGRWAKAQRTQPHSTQPAPAYAASLPGAARMDHTPSASRPKPGKHAAHQGGGAGRWAKAQRTQGGWVGRWAKAQRTQPHSTQPAPAYAASLPGAARMDHTPSASRPKPGKHAAQPGAGAGRGGEVGKHAAHPGAGAQAGRRARWIAAIPPVRLVTLQRSQPLASTRERRVSWSGQSRIDSAR